MALGNVIGGPQMDWAMVGEQFTEELTTYSLARENKDI